MCPVTRADIATRLHEFMEIDCDEREKGGDKLNRTTMSLATGSERILGDPSDTRLLHGAGDEDWDGAAVELSSSEIYEEPCRIVYVIWTVVFLVYTFPSFAVWLATIMSKSTRRSPFNVYLLFLLWPDWFQGVLSTYYLATATQQNQNEFACSSEPALIAATTSCRSWLSAVIAYEIHYMLRSSTECLRYHPPTRWSATRKSVAAYVLGAGFSFLVTLGFPNFSQSNRFSPNSFCGRPELISKYMLLVVAIGGVLMPLGYFVWVLIDIKRRRLLPHKGQRRILSLYYIRMIFVWSVLWIPNLIIVVSIPRMNVGVACVAGIVGLMQVALATWFALKKRDVAKATQKMFLCRRRKDTSQRVCQTTNFSQDEASSSRTDDVGLLRVSSLLSSPRRPSSDEKQADSTNDNDTCLEMAVEKKAERRRTASHTDDSCPSECYDDIPRQSSLHYQFDDELEAHNPKSVIAFHIVDEEDESSLPVSPF